MKLFLYDEKHETVYGELDLGEITEKDEDLLENVFNFLSEQGVTSRYNFLVLANNYSRTYDEENDFAEINFE